MNMGVRIFGTLVTVVFCKNIEEGGGFNLASLVCNPHAFRLLKAPSIMNNYFFNVHIT